MTFMHFRAGRDRRWLLSSVAGLSLCMAAGNARAWDWSKDGWSVRVDSTATLASGIVTDSTKTPLNSADGGPLPSYIYAAPAVPFPVGALPGGAAGFGATIARTTPPTSPAYPLAAWAALSGFPNPPSALRTPPSQFLQVYSSPYGEGINYDLPHLNFRPGDFYSGSAKMSHDIEIKYANFTGFFRGYYFYDAVMDQSDAGRVSQFGPQIRRLSGLNFVPLDSFIDGKFDVDGHALDVRIGKQVVNWGESTFLLQGINAFNPVDVTAFHRPGTEIKEVILPQWMAYASLDLFSGLSASGWYQLQWEPYQTDPTETFFAGSSASGQINTGFGGMGTPNPNGPLGASYLAVGSTPWSGTFRRNCTPGFTDYFEAPGVLAAQCAASPYVNYTTAFPSNGSALATRLSLGDLNELQRIYDFRAPDPGQFGLSLKFYSEALNSTEFGLYYADYNSRLPIYSNSTALGTTPSLTPNPQVVTTHDTPFSTSLLYAAGFAPIYAVTAGVLAAAGPNALKAGVFDPTGALGPQIDALAKVPLRNPTNLVNPWTGVPIRNYGDLLQARAFVLGNPNNVYLTPAGPQLAPGLEAPMVPGFPEQAELEYPKHIREFGASFNTTVGSEGSGIGIQGEVSYKKDDIVQLNDLEILLGLLNDTCFWPTDFGVLGTPVFEGNSQLAKPNASGQQWNCNPGRIASGNRDIVHGYMRTDSISAQISATQFFNPSQVFVRAIGADLITLVSELGMLHYNSLPNKYSLQLQQPNEMGNVSPLGGLLGLAPLTTGYPTPDSGGLVVYTAIEYDNAFDTAVTVSPTLAWKADLWGITPDPTAQYIHNRQQVSFGVDGSYQNRIRGSISYTTNWGGGFANAARGQSFVAASVSYSF